MTGLKAFFKGILDVQPWDYDAKGQTSGDFTDGLTSVADTFDSSLYPMERRRVPA